MSNISLQKGAVSIFIVIFTTLLITIVIVSFARLMVRDLQRASDSDLSKSAYDSALVGVEDAKRALVKYYQMPVTSRPDLSSCNAISQVLTGITSSGESLIQTNAGDDGDLNQAYSCVKVNIQTRDYVGELNADKTQLIPLRSVGSFNQIKIEWFSRDDLSGATAVNLPATAASSELTTSWPAQRPPAVETQLIQTNSNFDLEQFDNTAGDGKSNTNTLLFYPRNLVTTPAVTFTNDVRRSKTNDLTDVDCSPSLVSALYSCIATVAVPEPINGNSASRSNAFLRLTARYNKAHFKISLFNGSTPVLFDGVQPEVDSTGRANDLFRRVSARVETGANIVYPEAAVDISGNFCKTFAVTDRASDYQVGGCTP